MVTKEASINRQGSITQVFRWLKLVPIVPIILLLPFILWGAFGEVLCPHDPYLIDLTVALKPPAWLPGGDWTYFLGTDQLGRDLFSRVIAGARSSLLVAVFGVFCSGFIGVLLGIISGFLGGKVDNVIMRITDTWMSIPPMFFLLVLVAISRESGIQGLAPIIIAISVTMWVPFARIVRAETLSIKQQEYIALARVTGCSNLRIMIKDIWPGVLNTIVVMATMQLGGTIMAESGLSFLGVGVQPPQTAWGLLISESSTYMSIAWWIPTFAGFAITITILGANLFGDWLRDTLDPITRQTMK